MIDFSSRASIFLQPQPAGLSKRSVHTGVAETQASQMVSGIVLFSGLFWEVRRQGCSLLLPLPVCQPLRHSGRSIPSPCTGLAPLSFLRPHQAASGGPCVFRACWGGGGGPVLDKHSGHKSSLFHPLRRTEASRIYSPGSQSTCSVLADRDVHTSQNEQLPLRFPWL